MVLRSISLCAGIGGIDLGLRGIARTVAYCEVEAFAAANLVAQIEKGNLDSAPIWSDLRTFCGGPWAGKVDLVTGGYPCQPFSLAGKRLGADDPRHLWPDVLRVLQESEAPLGFFENVRGHVTKGLPEVLGDLAAVGFDVEWGCYSAAEVGAPHRRDRLWILAHRPGYLADARRRGAGWLQRCAGGSLGDADRTRLEGRGESLAERAYQRLAWPPGPEGDWRDIPRDLWPAIPVEPEIHGLADELSARLVRANEHRVDKLRALGNAVVPAVARRAFVELVRRACLGS